MCGIAGGFDIEVGRVRAGVAAIKHRGPDHDDVVEVDGCVLGHARLAIQDLDARSNQPFAHGSTVLAYNGELWNAAELRAKMPRVEWQTTGDTEVLAAALNLWGPDALPLLDGQFAFAWYNRRDGLCLARDRFGEVPLHWSRSSRMFASEMKAMKAMGVVTWQWLEPGTWVQLDAEDPMPRRWYDAPVTPAAYDIDEASKLVHGAISDGCARRTISDVPVCTLLSGGIDSSIVALHLKAKLPDLVAYVAVLDPKARDLRCARAVAEMIGVELREVLVAPPTADDLATVVRMIEQPHKAQVEIGHACLVLARRMRNDGFRVTFSGEGSDELWASYTGFGFHGVAAHGWHEYRKRLFVEQHRKNFARCNKVFLAHGVECRLPFLETRLVELALSLSQPAVDAGKVAAKAVLSRAYDGLLPREVLTRRKVAFQDGMKLKDAAAAAVADPRRYYATEFSRAYGAHIDP